MSAVDGASGIEPERVETPPSRLVALIILILGGIVLAWDIWAAVGNVIQVPAQFGAYRDFVTKGGAPELAKTTPWPALVLSLLVPALGWVAAWRLGRKRGALSRILLFVAAWAAVSAITVSLTAYVFQVSSVL